MQQVWGMNDINCTEAEGECHAPEHMWYNINFYASTIATNLQNFNGKYELCYICCATFVAGKLAETMTILLISLWLHWNGSLSLATRTSNSWAKTVPARTNYKSCWWRALTFTRERSSCLCISSLSLSSFAVPVYALVHYSILCLGAWFRVLPMLACIHLNMYDKSIVSTDLRLVIYTALSGPIWGGG